MFFCDRINIWRLCEFSESRHCVAFRTCRIFSSLRESDLSYSGRQIPKENKHQIWFTLEHSLPANIVLEDLVVRDSVCVCMCGGSSGCRRGCFVELVGSPYRKQPCPVYLVSLRPFPVLSKLHWLFSCVSHAFFPEYSKLGSLSSNGTQHLNGKFLSSFMWVITGIPAIIYKSIGSLDFLVVDSHHMKLSDWFPCFTLKSVVKHPFFTLHLSSVVFHHHDRGGCFDEVEKFKLKKGTRVPLYRG